VLSYAQNYKGVVMVASLRNFCSSENFDYISGILTKDFPAQAKRVSQIAGQFFLNKPLVAMTAAFFVASACATFQYLKNKKVTAELKEAESNIELKTTKLQNKNTELQTVVSKLKEAVKVKDSQLEESFKFNRKLQSQVSEIEVAALKQEEIALETKNKALQNEYEPLVGKDKKVKSAARTREINGNLRSTAFFIASNPSQTKPRWTKCK